MASLQASADSVRAAVGSISTCTAATVTILNELLLPRIVAQKPSTSGNSRTKTTAKSAESVRSKTTKATAVKSRGKKDDKENTQDHEAQLLPKEKLILATEVVNASLKTLTEAIKHPSPVRKKESSKDLVKASARKTLRRSNSVPHSPLQPRSLNRVSSSPNISAQHSRSSSLSATGSSGIRSVAECSRVAFACLRALQAAKVADLPPLQLENGMSVLVGKMIALGLDDLAIKELRILKRRLQTAETAPAPKKTALKSSVPNTNIPTLAELLEFGIDALEGGKLALAITAQQYILRLMISSQRHRHAETALPILRPTHPSSPTSLILLAATTSKPDKTARQLQVLSEILLSLTPSVSQGDDASSIDPRHGVTPDIAFHLQALAFHNRILWWKFAGHKGDAAKDLFDPFLRCLSAYARRSQSTPLETYHVSLAAFMELNDSVDDTKVSKSAGWRKTLSGIYRVLASSAGEANIIDGALLWTRKVQALLDPELDSESRRNSVLARLVGLSLRGTPSDLDEGLLLSLLDGLEKPLRGELTEIEDLLGEISSVRRSAISILAQKTSESLTDGLRELCETLVFTCPRLYMRYLGNAPDDNSAAKDILRYEQRRQYVKKLGVHAIDSVLFIIKTYLLSGNLTWELMESNLQNCLALLERIEDPEPNIQSDQPSSYYVKISNLYFSQYLNMRRDPDTSKDSQSLRVLKRSIDCLRSRPQYERKLAQFSTKLERMAEMCKSTGRYDELFKTLITLRDESIGDGVLTKVATFSTTNPFHSAWDQDEDTAALARSLQSLIKVQSKCLDAASQDLLYEGPWSDGEKGALLEQHLDVLLGQSRKSGASIAFQSKIFHAVLSLYDRQSYPIRRLRVITRLLALDQQEQEEIADSIATELDMREVKNLIVEGTNDQGLKSYLLHYQTLAMSLLELQQQQPDTEVFRKCLAVWSSIKDRCAEMTILEREIDDVPDLLTHLQLIADFMEVQGNDKLRVATLRLITDLNQLRTTSYGPDALVSSFTQLGAQWLRLGYSGKAGLALDRAQSYSQQNGVMPGTLLHLHLSYSEYLLTIGNFDKCEDYLLRAKEGSSVYNDLGPKSSKSFNERTLNSQLMSHAYLLYSMLDLERGTPHNALMHAKQGVRLLRRAWANTVRLHGQRTPGDTSPRTDVVTPTDETSQMNLSTTGVSSVAVSEQPAYGSLFWPLITPLFRALIQLSSIYAHHGMFRETIHYAEEAHTLVKAVSSATHTAMASAFLGSKWLESGALDKGSEFLMAAKQLWKSEEKSRCNATLSYQLGVMHGLLGDIDAEIAAYDEAETVLSGLTESDYINALDSFVDIPVSLEEEMSKLTISKKKAPIPRKTAARTKAISKRKVVARAKSPVEAVSSISDECSQIMSLKALVSRQKARVLTTSKKYMEAQSLLYQVGSYPGTQMDIVEHGLAMAKYLLLQSMDQMSSDPVYSILQESTISFPSIVGHLKSDRAASDRLSSPKLSPPGKSQLAASGKDILRSRSPVPDGFVDKLRRAQEQLTDIHSVALTIAPISVLHTISALLNSVAILLSAAGQVKGKSLAHPGSASCSIENVRTLVLQRERRAILADPQSTIALDETCWPVTATETRRSSAGLMNDMSKFQRDYIDIIPKNWTTISVSLSESQTELSITKLQAGHSPFVLRLPLGRNNSIDADEEVFGFEQGQSELREILQLANESAHAARELKGREAKAAWWVEREALDARLRDLLENIEKVWLGGFTGIFSQHARRPDLLARFQKSFQNILDKHLPSRQKTGRRNTSPRITLDSRILDLFIGLGDASSEECDFSEPLTDLLYFVVDVLQFHGELNAYAEIDFDSIVVETQEALRGYYEAARSNSNDEMRHTILILDKTLHSFPWESLPCMDGMAVSRLPSLGCFRDRILEQQTDAPEGSPEGRYVSRDNGSYILNPGSDLKATQTTFQKPLQDLSNWSGITKREPTEAEMKTSLESKDIMLYFGHGSGAQYIRAREIRTLKKCAVTILMGCSSGALVEAGDFEPYGPPINYMHAGCPALVATLWDVTDKDIDRFAKSAFEHWGLFGSGSGEAAAGSVGKGRGGKKKVDQPLEDAVGKGMGIVQCSLVEAVAKGRGACNLRYLTAAAVCVYGVPVYLK